MTRKPLLLLALLPLLLGAAVKTGGPSPTSDVSNNRAKATGSTTSRALKDRFADVVNVKDYEAKGDGVTDDTGAFAAALAALPATGGFVYAPPGRYKGNISITRSHVGIRGAGRRTTFLEPYNTANPALTIDATSATLQSVFLEDLGFQNGGTAAAILITGANINDWISLRRIWIDSFTNGISVLGRTIWSRFVDIEIDQDKGTAGVYISTNEAVNHLLFETVRVGRGAGTGFYISRPSGDTHKTITLHSCNAEANAGDGVYAKNVDELSITGSYFEDNTGASVRLDGTWARGFRISANLMWGGDEGFTLAVDQAIGYLGENLIANTTTNLDIATTNAVSSIIVGPNFYGDTGVKTITADGSGLTHVRFSENPVFNVTSTATTPSSVDGLNVIRFTNSSPLTITNLTGYSRGQVLTLIATSGNVTITNQAGGDGQFLLPPNSNYVLPVATAVSIVYDGGGWRLLSASRGIGVPATGLGSTTYGASVAINADAGSYFQITVTDANAFTVSAPTGGISGQRITIAVRNTTAGALGAITWTTGGAGTYRVAGFTSPAAGKTSLTEFINDGSVWRQVSTLADVPN